MTLFADVVAVSAAVGATSRRTEKRDLLATLWSRLDPAEAPIVVGFLVGAPRQGRIGIGWATVAELGTATATTAGLTVHDLDDALSALAAVAGAGSHTTRRRLLDELAARATPAEFDFIGRLLVGELRQGALAGVVTDAIAAANGIPVAVVRRAAMLTGDLGEVASLAATGGADAVDGVGLVPLRPIEPMLASTAASVDRAITEVGMASVEWKLDGARVQLHRCGDDVRIFTRNLNDVTDRLPDLVETARRWPVDSAVLDGEILGFAGPDVTDSPDAFQDTMSRFGRTDGASGDGLRAWWFDLLHRDGVDLIDEPLVTRRTALGEVVGDAVIPGITTDDPAVATAVLEEAVRRGHEGVMVKGADSRYDAGRRGKAWRKVKPVHTLDLVVLAAEWGSGRRQGWLSNLHLGALDPEDGQLIMVGKTFKGLTDALLAWQTDRFLELETGRSGHVVHVRPEQVVEIALDSAQVSTRYPGGVALRFARVRRYRDDKTAGEADTLDAVRALLPSARRH